MHNDLKESLLLLTGKAFYFCILVFHPYLKSLFCLLNKSPFNIIYDKYVPFFQQYSVKSSFKIIYYESVSRIVKI